MSLDPKSFNNPGTPTLLEQDSAGLGQAVLTLTHELWVVIDRVNALEGVLKKHGMNVSEEIENYTPSDADKAQLDQRGKDLVQRITDALAHSS